MRRVWYVVSTTAAIALVLVLAQGGPAGASNEIADREGLACTSCHDKPGSRLLTDRGKYYELMGTVDGFAEVTTMFGECTSCHVRKPGSRKLTETGRLFAKLVKDMDGLRDMLATDHPSAEESMDP